MSFINRQKISDDWSSRPWWMSLIWYFCLYMTFLYMPFDMIIKLFTQPVQQWEEIWFGFTLRGWAAKATEPIHWFIYGAGAYGFWKMKTWMWPWAGIYCLQVVIAMVVFNLINEKGGGIQGALISGVIFAIPTIALFRARRLFSNSQEVKG